MDLKIASPALYVLYQLRQHNFEAYLVGGAVRDLLNEGSQVTDYDFTTNATPQEIQNIFEESFYENEFGTVMVPVKSILNIIGTKPLEFNDKSSNKIIDLANASKIHSSLQTQLPEEEYEQEISKKSLANFEITTFRSDGLYSDHRRPETVEWGQTIDEDLSRRDFTINALALKITDNFLNNLANSWSNPIVLVSKEDYQVIDNHHGLADIKAKVIRTVGEPAKRFQEDALRMLRAIRLAAQLNFQLEESTQAAITANNQLINHVSWERIRDEFLKMITTDRAKWAIEKLDECKLLVHILPELLEAKNVNQAGHHTTDVWEHSLDALNSCPSKDPIVRLATLLHDIAKPRTLKIINDKPTFYNHEVVGSRMAKAIATRLKLSKIDKNRVFILVRYHMFHYQPHNTDSSIRRFMKKVGLENLDDILDLREADRLGSGARKTSWRLEEMKERMIEQLNQPMDVTDLAINGDDLMKELGVKPGPVIGLMLQKCLELVLDDAQKNSRDELLSFVKSELTKS